MIDCLGKETTVAQCNVIAGCVEYVVTESGDWGKREDCLLVRDSIPHVPSDVYKTGHKKFII